MGGDEEEVGGEVEEEVEEVQDRGHEAYHCHPLTSARSVFTIIFNIAVLNEK